MERRPQQQRGRGGGGRRRRPASASARAALRRKVRELRRLVPGGEDAPAGSLLLRTADYIARLRAQVVLLRALTALCSATTTPALQAPSADDASMTD
jgi:hypothetical protein